MSIEENSVPSSDFLGRRIVCRFSCGAASAVATKIAIARFGHNRVTILNAFIKEEHPDNQRFLADCQRWFEHPIIQLRDEKYGASAREVWRQKRFIKGLMGASCSKVLKRDVLDAASFDEDVMVLGFTIEEEDRYYSFLERNRDKMVIAPLIDKRLTKGNCLSIIERAGIELPAMYKLGFNNNNCIGCCKGGMGYWNKTREVFPQDFDDVAAIEEGIGPSAFIFRDRGTGKRYPLRQLPEGAGRHDEPEISCGTVCDAAESEWSGG